jgi:hypothetical protein
MKYYTTVLGTYFLISREKGFTSKRALAFGTLVLSNVILSHVETTHIDA